MNPNESILSTHFGAPVLHQTGFNKPTRAHNSPVEITESYFNYTRTPLSIVKRNGLIIPLPPEPLMGFDENLIVRVEFVIRHATLPDIRRQLGLLEEADEEALKQLRYALENSAISPIAPGVKITLDYPLSLAELKKYGGTVYYGELDLVASIDPPETVIPHPHSEKGRKAKIAASVVGATKSEAFGYSIYIVDNFGKYGPRYVNIGSKVYRVNSIRDNAQKDGIYVVAPQPVEGDIDSVGEDIVRYDFEGAEDSVGLYRTYDEAASLGDLSTARKRSLAELEQSNLVLTRDLANMKNQQAIDSVKRDQELAEVTERHNREKLALEERIRKDEVHAKEREAELERKRQELKDYYEERSLARKDSSETMKVLPAIIVGVGAVAAVLLKLFK